MSELSHELFIGTDTMPKKQTPDNSAYPTVEVKLVEKLTTTEAKKLLGWQEQGANEDFGNDYDLLDLHKKKIRLNNNRTNRPFDKSNARTWQSEILKGNWKLNGETLIIGKEGTCLDCQHRLVALVLANQEWSERSEDWDHWGEEPTISCIIVFGISESDDVVNTINTGKPRSFSDVVFRSQYFSDYKVSDRKKVSKILEWAVKFVANRSGAFVDAYSTKQTHSELIQFVDRHPTLLECAKFIFEENGDSESRIKKIISLGSAAGLLYLQASSKSEPNKWKESSSEDSLDMELLSKASDFWNQLAEQQKPFANLRKVLGGIIDDTGASNPERTTLCIKAWNLYVQDKPMTSAKLALKYNEDEEGIKTLAELPVVGGIDFGTPEDSVDMPSEDELKEAIEKESPKPESVTKLTGMECPIGSTVWVVGETEDDHWSGEIIEFHEESRTAKVKAGQGFSGAGNIYETPILTVQSFQPE